MAQLPSAAGPNAMMRPAPTVPRVFLCVSPVDFRKSINGLSLIVEQSLSLDPFQSALFVFVNRQCNKVKILYWEKNGFCLWYKSLQKQRFKWPKGHSAATVLVNGEELNWLLDGFDLWRSEPHRALRFSSVG